MAVDRARLSSARKSSFETRDTPTSDGQQNGLCPISGKVPIIIEKWRLRLTNRRILSHEAVRGDVSPTCVANRTRCPAKGSDQPKEKERISKGLIDGLVSTVTGMWEPHGLTYKPANYSTPGDFSVHFFLQLLLIPSIISRSGLPFSVNGKTHKMKGLNAPKGLPKRVRSKLWPPRGELSF